MKPTFRCSGLDDAFRCFGSRLVRARVGETTGKAAAAGNWGHYEGATRICAEFGGIHLNDRGDEAPLEEPKTIPGWVPSWFDIWMVDFYVGVIRDTMDADMLPEVEVALTWEFARFILTGHLDALAISPDGRFAKAWDYKSGEYPVDPADENWQVLGYIVLLFLAYEHLQEVTFYIVQPRNDEEDGWERVSEVTVKRDRLEAIVAELEKRVGESIDRENELETGWKQCRYCAGATQCAAIRKLIEYMKHLMASGELELIQANPDMGKLIETFLSLKTVNSVFERAKDEVGARVDAAGGALVFGEGRRAYFKEGNGGRTCTDMNVARTMLRPVLGDAYDAVTKLKFEDAEKALAKALSAATGTKVPHKSEVVNKTSGASELKRLLEGVVEQKLKRTLMIE